MESVVIKVSSLQTLEKKENCLDATVQQACMNVYKLQFSVDSNQSKYRPYVVKVEVSSG